MLYQSVRPKRLEDVFGNEMTIQAIKAYLDKPASERSRTLLLYGPTGCGKTTLARIIAEEVGCDSFELEEIDAANTRGIDTVRDVANRASIEPYGDAKVFIFDESHQLTAAAQQALLKITEDCPEHCYFIFCTTDKNRLIETIRNRSTAFEVSPLGEREVAKLVTSVCSKKGFDVQEEVIGAIAYASEGSPRRAIVLLDMVKDIKDEETIVDLLSRGTDADETVWDLCDVMLADPRVRKKKWTYAYEMFMGLAEDSESIRKAILSTLMKRLARCDEGDVEIALDISYLIKIFSPSTYYGGKPQLAGMIAEACLSDVG